MSNPVIACATDNNYAMSLGVTMLSAARNLPDGKRIRLFVMDGGLSQENRTKLESTWADEPIDLEWVKPDPKMVAGFLTSHHISSVAYFRILLPQVLPDDVERVLYLDSDLLVQDDISWLWQQDLGNWLAMAIADVACPAMDAKIGLAKYKASIPYLASLRPVRNLSDFEIDPNAPYFNSGVLLMNLAAWREQGLTDQLLNCLTEYRQFIWCWDQYALNAILAGKWKPLPFRWNLGSHAFEFPTAEHAPMDPVEFQEAIDDPAIVHFTTEFKPWHYNVSHPFRKQFFEYLAETAWADWQPTRPRFKLKKWMDRRGATVQKQLMISYRKWVIS